MTKKITGKSRRLKRNNATKGTRTTPQAPQDAEGGKSPEETSRPETARSGLVPVKTADYLTEDDPVTGQAFACVSFASPTDILPRKDAFFFERYVRDVFVPKTNAFADAAALTPEKVAEFAAGFKQDISDICADFDAFCASNQTSLEDQFAAENPDSLTTEGFKVRGSYPTLEAARKRAESLRDTDPAVDVFVAQVGAWCPFNPRSESVGEVVYQESELNTLMKMKREADARKDEMYRSNTDARVEAAKREGAGGERGGSLPAIEEIESGDDDERRSDGGGDGVDETSRGGDGDGDENDGGDDNGDDGGDDGGDEDVDGFVKA